MGIEQRFIGNTCAGAAVLAGALGGALVSAAAGVRAHRDEIRASYESAVADARRAGRDRETLDCYHLAISAVEMIRLLEAENQILREAVQSRDRAIEDMGRI